MTRAQIPDPQDPSTFALSRLSWSERAALPHAGVERLYRTLLDLRRHEADLRDRRAPFEVFAADEDTVVMRRGRWVLVTRLRDSGTVRIGSAACDPILTTEDADFCDDGRMPEVADAGRVIRFGGPSAVLLTRR